MVTLIRPMTALVAHDALPPVRLLFAPSPPTLFDLAVQSSGPSAVHTPADRVSFARPGTLGAPGRRRARCLHPRVPGDAVVQLLLRVGIPPLRAAHDHGVVVARVRTRPPQPPCPDQHSTAPPRRRPRPDRAQPL